MKRTAFTGLVTAAPPEEEDELLDEELEEELDEELEELDEEPDELLDELEEEDEELLEELDEELEPGRLGLPLLPELTPLPLTGSSPPPPPQAGKLRTLTTADMALMKLRRG